MATDMGVGRPVEEQGRQQEDVVLPIDELVSANSLPEPCHRPGPQNTALEDPAMRKIWVKIERQKMGSTLDAPIYRVSPDARKEDNAGSYDPKLISIGPFHHRNPNLQPSEKHKDRYLRDLLSRCPTNISSAPNQTNAPTTIQQNSPQSSDVDHLSQEASLTIGPFSRGSPNDQLLQEFVNEMRRLKDKLKQHYEKIELDSDAFVEMMVTDGGFIIEFLIKHRLRKIDRELADINKWWLLKNDLFLIENQIPFLVLDSLFKKLVICIKSNKDTSQSPLATFDLRELVVHYLKSRNGPYGYPVPDSEVRSALTHMEDAMKHRDELQREIFHLLHFSQLIQTSVVVLEMTQRKSAPRRSLPRLLPSSNGSTVDWSTIKRGAMELQDAGIRLKPNNADDCLLKVSFKKYGSMEIPQLLVHKATNSEFRNLIHFEQFFPNVEKHFACYALFMGRMMRTAEDVHVLRKNEVVNSDLGSEELNSDGSLALMFARLSGGTDRIRREDYLYEVIRDVNSYCERKSSYIWRLKGGMYDLCTRPFVVLIIAFLSTYFLSDAAVQKFFEFLRRFQEIAGLLSSRHLKGEDAFTSPKTGQHCIQ